MTDSKVDRAEIDMQKSDIPRLDQINKESEQSSAVFYSVTKKRDEI